MRELDEEIINKLQRKSHIAFREYCKRNYGEENFYINDDGEYESYEIRETYYGWVNSFNWLIREISKDSNND